MYVLLIAVPGEYIAGLGMSLARVVRTLAALPTST